MALSLPQGQYDVDVASFCERSVDVMGEESDHIHAQALTDALQVPVRIIQVDSSSSPVEAGMVDMQPEGCAPQQQATPAVQLLYRPVRWQPRACCCRLRRLHAACSMLMRPAAVRLLRRGITTSSTRCERCCWLCCNTLPPPPCKSPW